MKAVDRAYRAIRADILAGVHPPHSHLKEEELAEKTGVSRTPVREALRRLATEHLVRFVANQGATVADWTSDDVIQIFELRALLEGYTARRAARHISAARIAELSRLAGRMETIAGQSTDKRDMAAITRLNHAFHNIIKEAAASEYLDRMLSWIIEIPVMLRTFTYYSESDLARSMAHHREIIAALAAADEEWSEAVMRAHIHAARAVCGEALEGIRKTA